MRKSHARPLLAGAFLGLGLTVLTACGIGDGHGNATIQQTDNSGAEVINMPHTFGNLATKCSHGFRLWSTTHGSSDDKFEYASQVLVQHDPNCPQDGPAN